MGAAQNNFNGLIDNLTPVGLGTLSCAQDLVTAAALQAARLMGPTAQVTSTSEKTPGTPVPALWRIINCPLPFSSFPRA